MSNIIVGLIFRNINYIDLKTNYIKRKINISKIIKDTLDTLLMILGTLIFFNIIINLLPIKNMLLKNILNGFLEITTGLKGLEYLDISTNIKRVSSIA